MIMSVCLPVFLCTIPHQSSDRHETWEVDEYTPGKVSFTFLFTFAPRTPSHLMELFY